MYIKYKFTFVRFINSVCFLKYSCLSVRKNSIKQKSAEMILKADV